MPQIRLATRRSPLAMWQAHTVADQLTAASSDVDVVIVAIDTQGDTDTSSPLSAMGGRGVFVKEIQRALLSGEVDAAVHSGKDLQLDPPDGLSIAAVLERADARDAMCGTDASSLAGLPHGARIATGSVRRSAALRHLRPDFVIEPIRGNIQTRLERSAQRNDHGCVLAAAGLHRIGLDHHVGFLLDVTEMVPEPAQGAIVVEAPVGSRHAELFAAISHRDTADAIVVERAVAAELGGGCTVPIGVHVRCVEGAWVAHVFVADPAAGAASYIEVPLSGPIASASSVTQRIVSAVRAEGVTVTR